MRCARAWVPFAVLSLIVVEPTQGNYQRVESLEGAEFPLLVVTGVDAQGQPSGTEPHNPDGR